MAAVQGHAFSAGATTSFFLAPLGGQLGFEVAFQIAIDLIRVLSAIFARLFGLFGGATFTILYVARSAPRKCCMPLHRKPERDYTQQSEKVNGDWKCKLTSRNNQKQSAVRSSHREHCISHKRRCLVNEFEKHTVHRTPMRKK